MVLWSSGPVVLWSCGPLVRWSEIYRDQTSFRGMKKGSKERNEKQGNKQMRVSNTVVRKGHTMTKKKPDTKQIQVLITYKHTGKTRANIVSF